MLKKLDKNQLELISEEKNIDTDMVTLTIKAPLQSGGTCEIRMARADLDDHKKMKTTLLNKGCPKLPDLALQLDRILASTAPNRIETTNIAGWYDDQLITRYGTYTKMKGTSKKPQILFDKNHPMATFHTKAGKLNSYNTALSEALSKSNYLTFFLAAALAPALADRIGLSGAYGFNLSGQSSTGKTLSLKLCQSVYSRATDHDLTSFGNTTGYTLANLSSFGGLCIPFTDPKAAREKGKALCEKMQTVIFSGYDAAQRQGLNSEKIPQARFFISLFNSERPLADIFSEAGYPYEKGDMVRLIDIPVSSVGGIFDKITASELKKSSQYAQSVETAITENYGVLFPEWASYLASVEVDALIKKYRIFEKKFFEHIIAKQGKTERLLPLTSEEMRMAKAFALVAVSGYIASTKDILTINSSEVPHAAAILFERARQRMSKNSDNNDHIKTSFENLIQSSHLFPLITTGMPAKKSECASGFKRHDKGALCLYISREIFDTYFSMNTNLDKDVLPKLHKLGIVNKYKDGWTAPTKQMGLGRPRLMKINLSQMQKIKPSSREHD